VDNVAIIFIIFICNNVMRDRISLNMDYIVPQLVKLPTPPTVADHCEEILMPLITIQKRPREEAVVTQRKFFKKTARGKVIKGVSYLLPAT
jgi:hypothetical protein